MYIDLNLKAINGSVFRVYSNSDNSYSWKDNKGCGFSNNSLDYILNYLTDTYGDLTLIYSLYCCF